MSSQQNCDTVGNMNNKVYRRIMSLDPYQNKLPIVDYGLPIIEEIDQLTNLMYIPILQLVVC